MSAPAEPSTTNPPSPPPVSAAMALAHRRYWRINLVLIGVLMTIGSIVSFGVPLFAQGLGQVRIAGFPLPFYFGAQGAILVYVALIVVYIVVMQIADARLLRAAKSEAQDAA
jgi:putative solute:sodium symporter small subunit